MLVCRKMAAVKLVKNLLLICFLLYAETLQVQGSRRSGEVESDAPAAGHIVYDQRQSGKYNIHVVIKDVAIIEMDRNEVADQTYGDEDYYYDEDDLTVKPLNIKTTTTSGKPWNFTTTIPTSSEKQSVEVTTPIKHEFSTVRTSTTIPTKSNNINIVETNTYSSLNLPAVDTKPRSKIEPIYAIEEPVLHPKNHLQEFNYGLPAPAQSRDDSTYLMKSNTTNNLKNSRIYKVKVHRSNRPHQIASQTVRCRSYQYRDARGNCRGKRSSSSGSIIKRLFKMLIRLPFKQDEQQQSDD